MPAIQSVSGLSATQQTARETFLVNMYNQMFSDINRQLTVTWQSISVLASAFAILALIEKNIIPLDVAISILLLVCAWSIAHLYEASYWYNRNLAIISNIERQFLVEDDLRNISYYFGNHRGVSSAKVKNTMIEQLKIHYAFSVVLGIVVLIYHFSKIIPHLSVHGKLNIAYSLPYLVVIGSTLYMFFINRSYDKKYIEFLQNSPGIQLNTTTVRYGPGHGV